MQIASGVSGTVDNEAVEETQGVDLTEPQGGTTEAQGAMPEAQGASADNTAEAAAGEQDDARERRLTRENNQLRKRLRALEEAQREQAEADLTEAERQAKRLAELEQVLEQRDQQTRRLALESAVAVRSNALGIVDAEVAVKLLDTAQLDFDDAGRPDPESVDTALKRLIKAKPYLKTQPPAASPANPARTEPLGETDEQRRARLFGGGGGIFDPVAAQRLGGGVINPEQ